MGLLTLWLSVRVSVRAEVVTTEYTEIVDIPGTPIANESPVRILLPAVLSTLA